ncbi:MAG: hypothetical protein AAGJ32_12605 [Pseudomonadota bacterium]
MKMRPGAFRHLLCAAFTALFIGMGSPAWSQAEALKPAGWSESQRGAMTVFQAPGGGEAIMVRTITGTSDPRDGARAIAEGALGTGFESSRSSMDQDGPLAIYSAEVDVGDRTISLSGTAIAHGENAVLAVAHMGPSARADLAARRQTLKSQLKSMVRSYPTNAGPTDAPSPAPVPIAESPATPRAPSPRAGTLAVQHTVFDLDYRGGVGGFTYPVYTPVYLLKDGRLCRCTGVAPGEMTEATLSQASPGETGRWRAEGGGFSLQYRDGSDPEIVKSSLAKPAPLPKGGLVGRYTSVGGGGNVAFGGGAMTAQVEDLTFYPDGSFSETNFAYGSAPRVGAWSKRGTAGTFTVNDDTLTLLYRDGHTVKTSIYYSSKRKPSADFGRLGVLWIGGESFSRQS